jgi:hypothetical protein
MNEPTETKVCPYCAETIKAAAKRCPWCQALLGLSHRWFEGLVFLAVPLGLMLLAVFFFAKLFEDEPNKAEREFARHRDELGVFQTAWQHSSNDIHGVYAGRGAGPAGLGSWPAGYVINTNKPGHSRSTADFFLTGLVTNRANRPWRVLELDVQVLDPSGSLVDAQTVSVDERFVVQPGHANAFRVTVRNLATTNLPVTSLVRVHLASDGNRDPEPFL